tara:strand:- start:37256 stop:37813 length:558 start_codon:yes stop_codon:yes gene_type:complete
MPIKKYFSTIKVNFSQMSTEFKKFKAISTGSWVPEKIPKNRQNVGKTYKILIEDLVLNALIGIHEHEKDKEQKISINILINVKEKFSKTKDDIKNVVSYEHIVDDIKQLINSGHTGLLETLAEGIFIICFKDKRVLDARVTLKKLEVFSEAKSVGIEIFRKNKNLETKKNPRKVKNINTIVDLDV